MQLQAYLELQLLVEIAICTVDTSFNSLVSSVFSDVEDSKKCKEELAFLVQLGQMDPWRTFQESFSDLNDQAGLQ